MFKSQLIVAAICVLSLANFGCDESEIHPLAADTPTATLGNVAYPSGNSAINTAGTATLALTLKHAESTTLAAASGTSSAPPAGIAVSTTGGVSCSNISVASPSEHGATVTVTGCTGDGNVLINVEAGIAKSKGEKENEVSGQKTIVVLNTPATATLARTHAVVGTLDAANTVTVTFNHMVKALSANNSGAEFTVSGCVGTAPTFTVVTTAMSTYSIATATLAAGACADGNTLTVGLDITKILDVAGNAGAVAPTSVTYSIDTTVPTATLATAAYPATQLAINSSAQADLVLTFANVNSQNFTGPSGTSAAPPVGLTVSNTGTAVCSNVTVATPLVSGATIQTSGCTGDGTILVNVNANIAFSNASVGNLASAQQTVIVDNTAPAAPATNAGTSTAAGGNILTATFTGLVAPLDTTNATGVLEITGCGGSSGPTLASIVMSGATNSVATITLNDDDPGPCPSPSSISVKIRMDKVYDRANNPGTFASSPTISYTTP